MLKSKYFSQAGSYLLVCSLALPSAQFSFADTTQKQQYQDAATASGNAKTANMLGVGIWGIEGALCGMNCFKGLVTLKADREAARAAVSKILATANASHQCAAAQPELGHIGTLAADVQTQMSLADADQATAASAQAGPVPVGAVASSKAPTANEQIDKDLTIMADDALIAANKAKTFIQEAASTVAGAGPATELCGTAATLDKDVGTLQAAATKLTGTIAEINSLGKICMYGGIAAAAADIGLSAMIEKKLETKNLISIAGAAPGAYSLVTGANASNASTNGMAAASSQTMLSCVETAISLGLVAVKVVGMMKNDKSQKDNQQKADSMSALFQIQPKELGQWYAVFGWNLIVPQAEASGFSSKSPCSGSLMTPGEKLECATSTDSLLKHYFSNQRANAVFAAAQREFGASPDQLLRKDVALSPQQIASMITRDHRGLEGKVKFMIDKAIEDELNLQGGVVGPLAALKSSTNTPAIPSLAVSNLSEAGALNQMAGSRGPAAANLGVPSEAAYNANAEGIVENSGASIFQIVSKKYEKITRAEFADQQWATPFNRSSQNR